MKLKTNIFVGTDDYCAKRITGGPAGSLWSGQNIVCNGQTFACINEPCNIVDEDWKCLDDQNQQIACPTITQNGKDFWEEPTIKIVGRSAASKSENGAVGTTHSDQSSVAHFMIGIFILAMFIIIYYFFK